MSDRKLVLITGAAGSIGRVVREGLKDRYRLRLMYHRTVLPAQDDEEVVVGNLSDLEVAERAVAGVDAIIHLAGDPKVEATFQSTLENNIVATYNIYEAARRHGVGKVIFASTNHVSGYYELDGMPASVEMPIRPDGYYGASKAYGEALGRFYSDRYGLSIICLRIGSFLERPRHARNLATWLSHRDCVQLMWRGIESPVPFAIVYGISGNDRRYWDISGAQQILGYEPEDNAEAYAKEIMGNE